MYKKKGIKTAIAIIVIRSASAEFQIKAHINREHTAIKQVPLPSPLYPSIMFTVLANTATIIGTSNGYNKVNLVCPRNGSVGDEIVINL